MLQLSDYTALITSEHRQQRFMQVVAALAQPMVDVSNFLLGLPDNFDLDNAIGVQEDAVGEWVGITRQVLTPIAGVYFAFDTDGVGFDQGVWKGQFDPDSGVVVLDDDTYRVLLRAKIGANHWDGTVDGMVPILNAIFPPSTHVFVQDNQDMTMVIGISGQIPSALSLALLAGGYIPIKPVGVGVTTIVTSTDGAPIFGFDMNNEYVAGFDTGAWATAL